MQYKVSRNTYFSRKGGIAMDFVQNNLYAVDMHGQKNNGKRRKIARSIKKGDIFHLIDNDNYWIGIVESPFKNVLNTLQSFYKKPNILKKRKGKNTDVQLFLNSLDEEICQVSWTKKHISPSIKLYLNRGYNAVTFKRLHTSINTNLYTCKQLFHLSPTGQYNGLFDHIKNKNIYDWDYQIEKLILLMGR